MFMMSWKAGSVGRWFISQRRIAAHRGQLELALETAKAQQAQNEAQLELAKAQLERTAQLRKNDYATQETYDERVAQVNIATASRDAAIAAVNQAQLNLDYTTISAPGNGIVSKRNVEPGQVVQPGQPLMSTVNLEDIWVTANYKETQLEHMKIGQHATIHVDAYNRDYKGHVDSVGGGTGARFSLLPPENATGNYVKVVQRVPVKIILDPKEYGNPHTLRAGVAQALRHEDAHKGVEVRIGNDEIAIITSTEIGTVKSRIHRGRLAVRNILISRGWKGSGG